MPGASRIAKASCIGRRPSPASGSGGRKNNRLAVSTPSSATRRGTASSLHPQCNGKIAGTRGGIPWPLASPATAAT